MKKILLVLSILASLVVVGCSTPNTDIPAEEKKTVAPTQPTTPATPATPPEDKSPFEYVLPQGVDYNDYIYVGDYIFSDLVNFTQCVWFNGTENSTYGYFMVLKKKARVQYTGNGLAYELYDWDTDTYPRLNKGTRYEIYLKKTFLDSNPGVTTNTGRIRVVNTYGTTRNKNPDCNTFQIYANSTYTSFTIEGNVDINDYSTI